MFIRTGGRWLGGGAAVALGLGIWGFMTQAVGTHITDCGFDANGAYAKVRVNNLLGGAHEQRVYVDFYVQGSPEAPYEATSAGVMVPAHGRGTSVMHERFPPHGSFKNPTAPDPKIEGRTVYVLGRGHDNPRFVTKKVALKNRGWVSIETVPDDKNSLSCAITGDGW
jgi:hypothetical protein